MCQSHSIDAGLGVMGDRERAGTVLECALELFKDRLSLLDISPWSDLDDLPPLAKDALDELRRRYDSRRLRWFRAFNLIAHERGHDRQIFARAAYWSTSCAGYLATSRGEPFFQAEDDASWAEYNLGQADFQALVFRLDSFGILPGPWEAYRI